MAFLRGKHVHTLFDYLSLLVSVGGGGGGVNGSLWTGSCYFDVNSSAVCLLWYRCYTFTCSGSYWAVCVIFGKLSFKRIETWVSIPCTCTCNVDIWDHVLKASTVECFNQYSQSAPSINILIDTQLTSRSILGQHLIITWSTVSW